MPTPFAKSNVAMLDPPSAPRHAAAHLPATRTMSDTSIGAHQNAAAGISTGILSGMARLVAVAMLGRGLNTVGMRLIVVPGLSMVAENALRLSPDLPIPGCVLRIARQAELKAALVPTENQVLRWSIPPTACQVKSIPTTIACVSKLGLSTIMQKHVVRAGTKKAPRYARVWPLDGTSTMAPGHVTVAVRSSMAGSASVKNPADQSRKVGLWMDVVHVMP